MTMLKEYITDSLKRGMLQRSEAPDACFFFFIDKKDGKLCPVQDYRPDPFLFPYHHHLPLGKGALVSPPSLLGTLSPPIVAATYPH